MALQAVQQVLHLVHRSGRSQLAPPGISQPQQGLKAGSQQVQMGYWVGLCLCCNLHHICTKREDKALPLWVFRYMCASWM